MFRDIKAKHSVDIKYERDDYDTSKMIFNIYGTRAGVMDAWIELSDMYRVLVYKYKRKKEQKYEERHCSAFNTRQRIAELLGMNQQDIPLDMVIGYEMKHKM